MAKNIKHQTVNKKAGSDVINYRFINRTALSVLLSILQRWLPNGKRVGQEWVSLNPTRVDQSLGSFKVNIITGRWADFSTSDRGGDVISLAAYLFDISPSNAACQLAAMLGVRHD